MQLVLALLVAIVVFSAFLLINNVLQEKKRKGLIRERLSPDGEVISEAYGDQTDRLNGEPSKKAKAILGTMRAMGVNVDKKSKALTLKFANAGINSPDASAYYLLFQRVGMVVLLGVALMLFVRAQHETDNLLSYTLALCALVIGIYGPKLFIENKIQRRKKVLQRSFPDTLDLLLICVESGLALDASLNRVCGELGRAYPEITGELNRTRLELALINNRVKALMNLGERTDLVAFRSLVAALIQSERFGTSLTDTMRVLSEDFRLMRLADAEAKAARLPVLMTVPLIMFLLPAFFLIIMGPAIISFIENGQEVTGRK